MRRLVWILMVPLLLAHALSGLLVMAAFYTHQEDIAQQYCARRFDAVSSCAGSCVLQKRLDKNREQEQSQMNQKTQEVYVVEQASHLLPSPAVVACAIKEYYNLYRHPFYTHGQNTSLLRPPIS
ncbi:hypothetical protein [Olivibacter sitiensis]|uniref:hypothetical protein n=1 Tax=Olivibacter sitiensis TaxID=376470 RepID=UPI00146FABEE|nr:hypothetical protein [Olivibacter sitiensis]